MLIYLLRHGDAVQSPNLQDSERPLSDLGMRQASSVGLYLNNLHLRPAIVISSPLVRAMQTADEVQKLIRTPAVARSEYLIPGTRKAQLFDELNRLHPESVLLVGHEPHLSQTISLLLAGTENLHVEMRKCSLACLLASDPLRPGHALLQWLVTVDQMAARGGSPDRN